MKKITISILAMILVIVPSVAFAADNNPIENLVQSLLDLAPKLMKIAFVVAGLAFIYSLTKFILNPADKEQGKTIMTWGLGALFIMFSFFGIIKLVQDMIFPNGAGTPSVPEFPKGK